MNTAPYIYATVPSHPLSGSTGPEPEALAQIRKKLAEWPDAKFAAFQCADLGSRNIGHLEFLAVGPGRGIPVIDRATGRHWSYLFVGFVNPETGLIESFKP